MAKRVTDEQDQGDIGQLQVHEHFKRLRWQPRPLTPDLGEDFIIDIYDEGVSAGLAFYAQVKSSANLPKFRLKNGDFSYPIDIKDLNHWRDYIPPVVLIIWDTTQRRGYWIAIADAIAALNKKIPGWKDKKKTPKGKEPTVNLLVPSANVLDDSVLKPLRHKVASLMLPAIIQGKQLSLTLNFSFSDSPHGRVQQDAMKRFIDFGEGLSIDGQFLTGIQISEWYERKFGRPAINPKGKFVVGPRQSNTIVKVRLTLLTSEGRAHQVEIIEVKAVRVGEKQMTLTNEHLPTPFAFRLIMRQSGHYSINISIHGTKTTAGEALRSC